MRIEDFQIIKAAAYCTRLRCSSINSFLDYVEPYFVNRLPSDIDKVFNEATSSLAPSGTIGQEEALRSLLIRDLKDIRVNLKRIANNIEDPETQIGQAFSAYSRKLNEWGIPVGSVSLRIEDRFPEPYTNIGASAMNYDVYDQKEFGIPRGVIFRRDYLLPIVSSFLLAHELIHCVFSGVYAHYLARGLEEGLCEIIGLILSSEILDKEIGQNILVNFRLSEFTSQKWQVYTEAVRQAAQLYARYGLKGVRNILKLGHEGGRGVVKEIEERLMHGHYENLGLDCGGFDAEFGEFLSFFVGYPQSLVVRPLSYYIAEKISVGDSVDKWVNHQGFDSAQTSEAIQELQDQVFLILLAGNSIVSDETKVFLKTKTLRYRIQKT